MSGINDETFHRDLLKGLKRGDFSRLEPLFISPGAPKVIECLRSGRLGQNVELVS